MKKLIIGTLLLLAAAATLPASVIYHFTVNTSSLNGQAGNLDFQLNPGSSVAPLVAGAITGFATDGTYTPADIVLTGDATGQLPSSLLLGNGVSYNDAYQSITFGLQLDFFLTLSGPGIDTQGSDGTTFALSLYDSAGTTALLTNAVDGSIAGVNADSSNGVQPFTNPPATGQPSLASVSAVPEPGTLLLLSCGLAGLGVARRKG